MKRDESKLSGIWILLALITAFLLLRSGNAALRHVGKWMMTAAAILLLLLILLIGIVVYFAVKSGKEEQNSGQRTSSGRTRRVALQKEEQEVLSGARQEMIALQQLLPRIRNAEIRDAGQELYKRMEQILKVLREKPEKLRKTRQFLNYYVPTFHKILEKYGKLEEGDAADPETTEKIKAYLADIRTAMEKQYQNLFEADKLDLSVEMKAMRLAFERDGLWS